MHPSIGVHLRDRPETPIHTGACKKRPLAGIGNIRIGGGTTRLEQGYPNVRILRQPVSKHAARGSSPHNDEIGSQTAPHGPIARFIGAKQISALLAPYYYFMFSTSYLTDPI
jgi:hypothetical protein